ncbi:DEAD/DEAH box helicase [Niastella sp. OAS944]|uniref:DEAD/DEAH box helicase n=1 Tax=Niastella sp. OAS944 TaxID=2664089 RepID=UPI0034738E8E
MKLKGLFIGIDRFESVSIPWLNCAKRDASALHALFSDTLGGQTTLLTDQQATRINIETQIKSLYDCDKDDIVVITFSGHGSDTHELIAYDTNLEDLVFSGIPLSTLAEWLTNIPSKQLVCILDCCFSGGMGAKAIQAPHKSRSLVSTQTLLEQLSGKGRLILTASGATEPAWETTKHGHGLLTYHLLNAMEGAEEVLTNGRISIFKLLEYVTTRVKDYSLSIGKIQHPVLLGHIDGGLEWPVFIRGKCYQAVFPERCAAKVDPSPQSLLAHGFPQTIINVWLKQFSTFNQLQLDAINEFGLFQGKNLLVSAPTSSGKTMIGELTAINHALNRKKSIFLFPLKALVNDKLNYFRTSYGEYGIKTIKATGESTSDDILPLMRGQFDICLMTYEKFSALAIANSHILRQISVVVVDEVQMVTDKSRGVNLEFLMTLLKVRRQQGIAPQLIALSAVIGNTNGFENWMEAELLKRTERPVPLDEGIIRADGSFRYIASDTKEEKVIPNFIQPFYRKGSSQDLIIPLVTKLISEDKKVIVFRETRGEASGCAGYLATSLQLPPANEALKSMPQGDPSLSSQKLRKVLAGGRGFSCV